MRFNTWILGIGAGAAFCVAGLTLLAVVVAAQVCGGIERTDYVGSLDEIFASHYPLVEQPGALEDGTTAVIETTYVTERCEYWPSPWERALTLLGPFVVLSISGALGARLGSTIRPPRGAVASALGCLLLIVWLAAQESNRSPVGLSAVVAVSIITLTAGLVGYLGGWVVQIRARKIEAVRIKSGAA
jgi:hypothetical protein